MYHVHILVYDDICKRLQKTHEDQCFLANERAIEPYFERWTWRHAAGDFQAKLLVKYVAIFARNFDISRCWNIFNNMFHKVFFSNISQLVVISSLGRVLMG